MVDQLECEWKFRSVGERCSGAGAVVGRFELDGVLVEMETEVCNKQLRCFGLKLYSYHDSSLVQPSTLPTCNAYKSSR